MLRYFVYRCTRLLFDEDEGVFVQNDESPRIALFSDFDARNGLTDGLVANRKKLLGTNIIRIDRKPFLGLVFDETVQPFNVFQAFSVVVWVLQDQSPYACVILVMMVFNIAASVSQTREKIKRMDEISKHPGRVNVVRNRTWKSISCDQLVPGDVFEINNDTESLPCDAFILCGEVICDESMLTGESVPVVKSQITDMSITDLDPTDLPVKHVALCGTSVIRSRGVGKHPCTAVAIKTGFNSAKGLLVRAILFPKPYNFKFFKDAIKFIGFLSVVAIFGFIISTSYLLSYGEDWPSIILRGLDLITIALPPALPATLTVGMSFAVYLLKKSQIFCTLPSAIIIGGRLDVLCFDKTGTLTEDGMDVYGFKPVVYEGGEAIFTESIKSMLDVEDEILFCLATCHSVKLIEDRLLGDPLEIVMLESTNWMIEEQDEASLGIVVTVKERVDCRESHRCLTECVPGAEYCQASELGIIRTFDFDSKLRRMSVIVKGFNCDTLNVYSKGAPEKIKERCAPETIPHDFDLILAKYGHQGFRVLALATKELKDTKYFTAQTLGRDFVESDLKFIGFLAFENKLKPESLGVMDKLNDCGFRNIMITGDNLLTAISVSRSCHLVVPQSYVFYPLFIDEDNIVFEEVNDVSLTLDSRTLLPTNPKVGTLEFSIACSGDDFRKIEAILSDEMFHRFLMLCQIYGRMSPDQKKEVVEELQLIDYNVAFCGDGANDCGALDAADVGISLSSAEASIAAPFTSQIMNISCVLQIIKQGRSALVTSFCCFKFMALYSIVQFTNSCLLCTIASNITEYEFIYADLFVVVPLALFMNKFKCNNRLGRTQPISRLISKQVLLEIVIFFLVQLVAQVLVFYGVRNSVGYEKFTLFKKTNFENTSLFYMTNYLFVIVAMLICEGKPFREGLIQNKTFIICVSVLLVMNSIVMFTDSGLDGVFKLKIVDTQYRFVIFVISCFSFVFMFVGQKLCIPLLIRLLDHFYPQKTDLKWKLIADKMVTKSV